jgi:hypothetical protein
MVIMSGCLGLVRTLSTLCPVSRGANRQPASRGSRWPGRIAAGDAVLARQAYRATVGTGARPCGQTGAGCAPRAVRPDWPARMPVAGASPGQRPLPGSLPRGIRERQSFCPSQPLPGPEQLSYRGLSASCVES